MAQHEQLATALLARHFQSLHVEQRMLAVRFGLVEGPARAAAPCWVQGLARLPTCCAMSA